MIGLKSTWPLFLLALAVGCSGDQQHEVEEDLAISEEVEEHEASTAEEDDSGTFAEATSADEDDAPTFGAGLKALKASSKATATSGSTQELKPSGEFLWVNVNRATVRAGANGKAEKIGVLDYGEKVEVLGRENGYVIIGEGRYVLRRQLTDRKERYVKKDQIWYVTAPDLNVREAPSADAPIVGRVTRGESVIAQEQLESGWVKIGDGQYVHGRYLTRDHREAFAH